MNFLERLQNEMIELEQRISALRKFIYTAPKFGELSTKHKAYLCAQLDVMNVYLFVLKTRIEDIEKE